MHQEFDFLEHYFQQNGYPEFLFVKNVWRFLHRIFSANDRTESTSSNLTKIFLSPLLWTTIRENEKKTTTPFPHALS